MYSFFENLMYTTGFLIGRFFLFKDVGEVFLHENIFMGVKENKYKSLLVKALIV
jgi:hypothetical protein